MMCAGDVGGGTIGDMVRVCAAKRMSMDTDVCLEVDKGRKIEYPYRCGCGGERNAA